MGFALEFVDFCSFSQVAQRMQHAFLDNAYRKVLMLQAAGSVFCAVLAAAIDGQWAAVSALFGGGAVVVGNLVYAFLARPSAVYAKSGGTVLLRHVLAEIAKILIVLGLVFGAFVSGAFVAGWLVAAMVAALMCQWLVWLFYK